MKEDHIAFLPYAWPRCTTVKIHWYRHAMRQIENFDSDPALLARFRLARCYKLLTITACSKLVDNLWQAVRRQLVDRLLADLLQDVRFLRVYLSCIIAIKNSHNTIQFKIASRNRISLFHCDSFYSFYVTWYQTVSSFFGTPGIWICDTSIPCSNLGTYTRASTVVVMVSFSEGFSLCSRN
jgi:hypothetical protein